MQERVGYESGRRVGRLASVVVAASLVAACSSGPTAPAPPPPPPPPPPASNLVVSGGDSQSAPPGQAVATSPEVRVTDSQRRGVAGVSVAFTVISGGGSVSNPAATTDTGGRASAGSWTLGAQEGTQELRASVSGLGAVTFTATAAAPAEPATLQLVSGGGQSATVGTAVPTPPRVRVLDDESKPVPGVTIVFSVVAGGGSVTGASATSNSAGEAAVASWTLGTTAGTNRLRARVSGVSPLNISATGNAGPAAAVFTAGGDGQSATVSTAVAVPPAVRVEDAHGNPVGGASVTFAVATGGGAISQGAGATGSSGVFAIGGWTLGPAPGSNTLLATVSGSGITGNPVTFTATGVAGGGGSGAFDIDVRFNSGSTPTAAQLAAFNVAESIWEDVVTGDLADIPVNRPAGTCSSTSPINETVDDLVIFVTLEPIDGAGGILGSAGPCLVRGGSNLPLMGSMRFDTADLANLESNGLLDEVILHEMGHVLGIGTMWPSHGLLADAAGSGGTDPHFTGSGAIAAFNSVGGTGYAGNKVPVEDTGGPGTRDGHWRESVFDTELMTGWIDFGANQLSLVTVESLDDMGYVVDTGEADSYSLPVSPSIVPRPGGATSAFRLEGDMRSGPIEVVDRSGRRVGVLPR